MTTPHPQRADKEQPSTKSDVEKESLPLDLIAETTTAHPQIILLEATTIIKENYSGVSKKENVVITNKNAWQALWSKIYSTQYPHPQAPEIDFEKELVIGALAGEFPSGGYSIEVVELQQSHDTISISLKSTAPGPRCGVTDAFTQPVHFVKVAKPEYTEVIFTEINQSTNCQP